MRDVKIFVELSSKDRTVHEVFLCLLKSKTLLLAASRVFAVMVGVTAA